MNNKENNNRRALTGALILALLIGLNLFVRYTRSPRSSTPPAVPTVALPFPTPTETTLTTPPTQSQDRPVANSDQQALSTDSSVLIPGSEIQMISINTRLNELMQELQTLEKPYMPPDLHIELQLADFDRFRWKLPIVIATETTPVETEPATPTPVVMKEIEILGVFKVKGRSKLLIREDNKVFLVNEGEEPLPDSIIFEETATSSYLVFDTTGATHERQLKGQAMSGVDKAVAILQGRRDQLPSFTVQSAELATSPEQLPNK
ncbi:MAG: hypothetical protein ACD_39C01222G0005 [uncultured bacterium]|nr:MAG: hypothetical protein ACD_39C01222G0005 [uncultured bacterium]